MSTAYVPLVTPPSERREPALWFAFQRSQMFVCRGDNGPMVPCCRDLLEHGLNPLRSQYLGTYDGRHCYTVELHETEHAPPDWQLVGLRDLFAQVEGTLAALSGRAFQIIDWDRNHQYCSRCGTPTRQRENERARECPACGRVAYPPVSPAVMILVTRGRELLLARKASFPAGRYSALAGFVEPGEMLEETAARETREEVGVEIGKIRYFGSQSWPFPHSLMVAFTAEHTSGAITPDGVEIEEARWFDAAALPSLPPPISISRRLIDTVARRLAAGQPAHAS
jgi:NAD+ diphosphatase